MGNATATMLIRFFNMEAGTAIRTSNEFNQKVVLGALNRCDGDVAEVKRQVKEWMSQNPDSKSLMDCFEGIHKRDAAPAPAPAPAPAEKPVAGTDAGVQYGMGLLEQTVVQLVSQMNAQKIEQNIMGSVEDKVREFIREEYGSIERRVVTVVDGKKVPMKGVQHEKFETVLKFVANKVPVFLTGPAGSGKNVLCKQVAEALGLNFYFTNAVTQEYKLTGFTDAMGNYQPTQFYKAFTEGGVFMLDEMDASIPEVLVILNAAIANRYFDFPAPIGYVEAHPDFRVIAAGNTIGHGADFEYVGRNQLDGASLNRFALVKIDYSEGIENSSAFGDVELAQFCRDYRKAAIKAGLQVIVSYRNIGMVAQMMQIMDLPEVLDTCLVKGLEKDDVNMILEGIKRESKYKKALREVLTRMG